MPSTTKHTAMTTNAGPDFTEELASTAAAARKAKRNQKKYAKKKAKKVQESSDSVSVSSTADGKEGDKADSAIFDEEEWEADPHPGPHNEPEYDDEEYIRNVIEAAGTEVQSFLNINDSNYVGSARPELYGIGWPEDKKKGRGVMALRTIWPGERIMDEKPLVVDHSYKIRASENVARQVKAMHPTTRAKFDSLRVRSDELRHWIGVRDILLEGGTDSSFDRDQRDIADTVRNMLKDSWLSPAGRPLALDGRDAMRHLVSLARYDSNRIFLERGSQRGSAVCVDASRLNHSCRPNAFPAWNKDTGRMTVHAIRQIKAGQEITINYVSEGVYDVSDTVQVQSHTSC